MSITINLFITEHVKFLFFLFLYVGFVYSFSPVLRVGDINCDGIPDQLVCYNDSIMVENLNISYVSSTPGYTRLLCNTMTVDDVTGDGCDDVVIGTINPTSVYVIKGSKTQLSSYVSPGNNINGHTYLIQYFTNDMLTGIDTCDFNKDGIDDLIVYVPNFVELSVSDAVVVYVSPIVKSKYLDKFDYLFYGFEWNGLSQGFRNNKVVLACETNVSSHMVSYKGNILLGDFTYDKMSRINGLNAFWINLDTDINDIYHAMDNDFVCTSNGIYVLNDDNEIVSVSKLDNNPCDRIVYWNGRLLLYENGYEYYEQPVELLAVNDNGEQMFDAKITSADVDVNDKVLYILNESQMIQIPINHIPYGCVRPDDKLTWGYFDPAILRYSSALSEQDGSLLLINKNISLCPDLYRIKGLRMINSTLDCEGSVILTHTPIQIINSSMMNCEVKADNSVSCINVLDYANMSNLSVDRCHEGISINGSAYMSNVNVYDSIIGIVVNGSLSGHDIVMYDNDKDISYRHNDTITAGMSCEDDMAVCSPVCLDDGIVQGYRMVCANRELNDVELKGGTVDCKYHLISINNLSGFGQFKNCKFNDLDITNNAVIKIMDSEIESLTMTNSSLILENTEISSLDGNGYYVRGRYKIDDLKGNGMLNLIVYKMDSNNNLMDISERNVSIIDGKGEFWEEGCSDKE